MKLIEKEKHRSDIDGLRAIAVLSVIIFHLGYLPSGFLGVDVFFVISGYLITDILIREVQNDSYSVLNFYIRRIRRILPLVSFICLVSLVLGLLVMLPDDLENLAQSVIATNFFSNNILQVLTTKNYWDVVNEFKPLMHTWSLAVEEQYYFLYPIIFSFFGKKKKHLILPVIIGLTIISILLFFRSFEEFYKFYLLPFRFFEMSTGGIAAILLKGKLIRTKWSPFFILALVVVLTIDFSFITSWAPLLACIVISCIILSTSNKSSKISSFVLGNKLFKFIGKISFSLYMWHQVLFAFGRYFIFEKITAANSVGLVVMTFTLSIITYSFIEQPFRNKQKFSTKFVVKFQVLVFVIITIISGIIIIKGGVIRDVPELDIFTDTASWKMHSEYNHRNYKLNQPFESGKKKKVLVLGDSFARDWINVLRESKYDDNLSISYIYSYKTHDSTLTRVEQADIVFFTTIGKTTNSFDTLKFDKSKFWYVGIKNFGVNNGLYYNYQGDDYFTQRIQMGEGYYDRNEAFKEKLGDRYLNIIDLVCDRESRTIPVFTPDGKFISQDCRHFTKAGAKYFAGMIDIIPNLPSLSNK